MSEAISLDLEGPITPVLKLKKDLSVAAQDLSPKEARYLVDLYYTIQNYRIRSGNQVRASEENQEPNDLIQWSFDNFHIIELGIRRAMNLWSDTTTVGLWSKSIHGIGPVIAAGLMAHVDIERAPTAGHLWSFAGLNPNKTWEKKTKRPWNAKLKTLCWKIGESFVKVKASEKDFYGKIYEERKLLEIARNEAGDLADQAASKLETTKIGKKTEAYAHYAAGHLPPAHIHSRAKRYAVKIFLSHYHQVAFESHFGTTAPRPYILAHGEHVHMIDPPNWPMN